VRSGAVSTVGTSGAASIPPASVASVLELVQPDPNSQIAATINDAICLGRFKDRASPLIKRRIDLEQSRKKSARTLDCQRWLLTDTTLANDH
jgi:hypothetical protein